MHCVGPEIKVLIKTHKSLLSPGLDLNIYFCPIVSKFKKQVVNIKIIILIFVNFPNA